MALDGSRLIDGNLRAQMGKTGLVLLEQRRKNMGAEILVVGALYAAAVFVFLSMAILALKTLAGMSEDQKKYQILFRLGTGGKGRTQGALSSDLFLLLFAVRDSISSQCSDGNDLRGIDENGRISGAGSGSLSDSLRNRSGSFGDLCAVFCGHVFNCKEECAVGKLSSDLWISRQLS